MLSARRFGRLAPCWPAVGPGREHALRLVDGQGAPGARVEDAAHLPAAEDLVLLGEGQRVDPVRHERVLDVVVRGTAVVGGVVDVRQGHAAVVVGVEVHGLAVGVRVQEREPVREPPLELHQQRVVVQEARAADLAHVAEQPGRRAMKGRLTSALRHAEDGRRLVRVHLDQHVASARAHVGDLDHVVPSELLLDVQVEVRGVGVAEVDVEDGAGAAGGRTRSDRRRAAAGARPRS